MMAVRNEKKNSIELTPPRPRGRSPTCIRELNRMRHEWAAWRIGESIGPGILDEIERANQTNAESHQQASASLETCDSLNDEIDEETQLDNLVMFCHQMLSQATSEEAGLHAWNLLKEAENRQEIMRQKRNDRVESPSLTPVTSDGSVERPKSSKASGNPNRGLTRIQEEEEQSEASSTLPERENPRTESTCPQQTEVTELE